MNEDIIGGEQAPSEARTREKMESRPRYMEEKAANPSHIVFEMEDGGKKKDGKRHSFGKGDEGNCVHRYVERGEMSRVQERMCGRGSYWNPDKRRQREMHVSCKHTLMFSLLVSGGLT